MMGRCIVGILLFAGLVLGLGCSQDRRFQDAATRAVPAADRQLAETVLQQIQSRQFAAVVSHSVPELQNDKAAPLLDIISRYLNAGTLRAQNLVGWQVNTKQKFSTLYYQQERSGSQLLLKIVISHAGSAPLLLNFDCQKLSHPLQQLHAFTFQHRTHSHYIMLALTGLTPLLIVLTFVRCLRRPVKMKFLWLVLILVGFASVTMNWTSGAVTVTLLDANLLGTVFFRGNRFSPWIIGFSLPIGAVLYWLLESRLKPTPATEDAKRTAGEKVAENHS